MRIGNIIGRSEEITRLDRCMEAISAQLIIIYGRRRVGKTYLINEYFNNEFAFKLTGAYKKTKAFQLESFADELKQKSRKTQPVPSDWRDAFRQLREYLETLPEKEKQVVFIDEMPWLDTPQSDFLPLFEWFWNDWASTRNNLVFIVCGFSHYQDKKSSWSMQYLKQRLRKGFIRALHGFYKTKKRRT